MTNPFPQNDEDLPAPDPGRHIPNPVSREDQVKWLKRRVYLGKMIATVIREYSPGQARFVTQETEMLQHFLNQLTEDKHDR